MNLFGTDTLVIEQPWGPGRHLFGTRYRVRAYTEHDVPVADATDRKGLGPVRKLLRTTGFSGRTTFDLVVAQHGQPLLLIHKGPGRPPVRVSRPDGTPVGALHRESHTHFALLDPAGTRLCYFGDAAGFSQGAIAKRDGRRVRRDVLRLRPGTPEPVRTLAVAVGLAFDVVRGKGTAHTGGGGFDLPAA
ncbi:hypothetical protein ABZ816_13145 [Actinosynnema sp. NPDC047251]|uniref:Uncharacterized protein n=1 Tax=Saccharothrix espanaensis (strain ATCC 51144 / DSM 44229 / JCM 9112 / NBRC 15066 / NRRL 15764) TaxID=1179773 RepID=K0KGA2_SACES|nr:hypothetical protein [Saccharothrix espanaensis]CCH35543.1 hypothetical protein BN6_83260 [Saccharothrix espanaensis DSM 44229]